MWLTELGGTNQIARTVRAPPAAVQRALVDEYDEDNDDDLCDSDTVCASGGLERF
jgi:hypothetical protein